MATTSGNVSPVLRPAKVIGGTKAKPMPKPMPKPPMPMPKPRPVKRGK